MKKFSLLPLLALVVAVAASAFTKVEQANSDLVWFKTNPSDESIISTGEQGATPPAIMNCQSSGRLCSAAFSIENEQVYEVDGVYYLSPGITVDDRVDDRHEP